MNPGDGTRPSRTPPEDIASYIREFGLAHPDLPTKEILIAVLYVYEDDDVGAQVRRAAKVELVLLDKGSSAPSQGVTE